MVKYPPWTDEEEEFLRSNYLTKNSCELSESLRRTPNAIGKRMRRLALKRPDSLLKQWTSIRSKRMLTGRPHSPVHKQKIGAALSAYHAKHPDILTGARNPNYGKHLSDDAKQRIAAANRGRVTDGFTGRHHCEASKEKISHTLREGYVSGRYDEVRKRISLASRRLWQNEEYAWKVIRNARRAAWNRPTSYEKQLQKLFEKHRLPFTYTGDGRFLVSHKNPDFIWEEKKLAIEVYHSWFKLRQYGTIEKYKKICHSRYAPKGWRVIFIDENDLSPLNWETRCLKLIHAEVKQSENIMSIARRAA